MRIPLSLIRPSPTPVRTTWDEDKMNELAQSIKEQGVIVPVKVRPVAEWVANCPRQQNKRWPMFCAEFCQYALEKYGQDGVENAPGFCPWCRYAENGPLDFDEEEWEEAGIPEGWQPYEVVYGHRRVEAASRAGLDEIEAIVEGVTDDEAFIQALIENVQREDMSQVEEGRAYLFLAETYGLSGAEIARRVGKYETWVQRLIRLARSPIRDMFEQHPDVDGGAVNEAVQGSFKNDIHIQRAIVQKVVQEGLPREQAKRVIQAVAAAPSPEAKRVLLEAQYSPVIHDPDMIRERAARLGAHDPMYQDTTPTKQQQYNQTPEVRATVDSVIDAAKRWNELIKVIRSMTEVGKLAPESRQFIAHRARQLAKTLTDWANELEAKE